MSQLHALDVTAEHRHRRGGCCKHGRRSRGLPAHQPHPVIEGRDDRMSGDHRAVQPRPWVCRTSSTDDPGGRTASFSARESAEPIGLRHGGYVLRRAVRRRVPSRSRAYARARTRRSQEAVRRCSCRPRLRLPRQEKRQILGQCRPAVLDCPIAHDVHRDGLRLTGVAAQSRHYLADRAPSADLLGQLVNLPAPVAALGAAENEVEAGEAGERCSGRHGGEKDVHRSTDVSRRIYADAVRHH